jgi:hypothetical protein
LNRARERAGIALDELARVDRVPNQRFVAGDYLLRVRERRLPEILVTQIDL